MIGAILIMANAMALPSAGARFDLREYPDWALQQRRSTRASVELTVNPDGKIENCTVLESLGSAELAAAACTHYLQGKVKPATTPDGTRVYSLWHIDFTMLADGHEANVVREERLSPDLELTVNKIPAGKDRMSLQVAVLIATDGKVQACEAADKSAEKQRAYADVACRQIKTRRFKVLKNGAEQPVPYVTNIRIAFVRQAAAATP
jgi:TonB family protein